MYVGAEETCARNAQKESYLESSLGTCVCQHPWVELPYLLFQKREKWRKEHQSYNHTDNGIEQYTENNIVRINTDIQEQQKVIESATKRKYTPQQVDKHPEAASGKVSIANVAC